MQRQSLGSPSSKLPVHGGTKGDTLISEEPRRRDSVSSFGCRVDHDEDDNNKAPKSHRLPSPPPRPEKFIHLIPILTLVCFLILYFCSHTPSPSDLDQFSRVKHSAKRLDSAAEINDIRQYIGVQRGDILGIRSLRNLQEIEKQSPKSRPHRKFANF